MRILATAVALTTVALLAACTPTLTTGAAPAAASANKPDPRPNLILISTDDQTDWDLKWMPRTRALIGKQGVNFTDAISPHPLCCPARAKILTGEYAQNNGVRHNTGPHGGYDTFLRRSKDSNLASWLSDAGYRTAFIGKMLNGYEGEQSGHMDGWDHWSPTTKGVYAYYGTTFENNGQPTRYPNTHVSDVISQQSVDLVDTYTADRAKPFFMWVSHVGPHTAPVKKTGGKRLPWSKGSASKAKWGPPIPAARHAHLYPNATLPTTKKKSFNEADVSDKPKRVRAKIQNKKTLTRWFRARIRTLASIDEANERLVKSLRANGALDNTVIMFISDNGFLLGEHRLTNKNLPYEETLQIPFLMRGPGIPTGTTSTANASLVDIAPTLLDYAGVLDDVYDTGRIDGLSLVGAASGEQLKRPSLIQSGRHGHGWTWRGVRTNRFTYARWRSGAEELYDRLRDPQQLNNLARVKKRRPALGRMRVKLANLKNCQGPRECRRA